MDKRKGDSLFHVKEFDSGVVCFTFLSIAPTGHDAYHSPCLRSPNVPGRTCQTPQCLDQTRSWVPTGTAEVGSLMEKFRTRCWRGNSHLSDLQTISLHCCRSWGDTLSTSNHLLSPEFQLVLISSRPRHQQVQGQCTVRGAQLRSGLLHLLVCPPCFCKRWFVSLSILAKLQLE